MLLFAILPGAGLAIYLLFGRGHKAFIRKHVLNEQTAPPVLGPMLSQTIAEHDKALMDFRENSKASARIATLVHSNSNSRVTTRNSVDVLQDAEAAYPAMIEALAGARDSIHLHYYSWGADNIGEGLLDLLAKKVKEGVEVRILYDPIGSWSRLSYRYLRRARKAGINIRPFSSIRELHTVSYRNHRKIALIDGKVAFVGGLNIGDEHIDPPSGFARWRDTNIKLRGSVVWSLQAIFLVDWSNATDEALSIARFFPPLSDSFDPDPTAVQICLSGPDSEYNAIRQLYFEMVVSAQEQVLIQSPFFILDETITEALKTKALSGVDVQVMISSAGPRQFVPYWAANTFAQDLALAGVTVQLYDAGYLHAKTICIDGAMCSIGSANWDIRSFSINYELTAVIYDTEIAKEIAAAIQADLAGCTRFDPDEYASRSRLGRFRDSVARLASPLL